MLLPIIAIRRVSFPRRVYHNTQAVFLHWRYMCQIHHTFR
jgi:hypothetical protein